MLLSDSLKVQFQKPYVGISVSEKFNALFVVFLRVQGSTMPGPAVRS